MHSYSLVIISLEGKLLLCQKALFKLTYTVTLILSLMAIIIEVYKGCLQSISHVI